MKDKLSIEEFSAKLKYFGGNITSSESASAKYIDLEKFVVDATNYMFEDYRLTRCMEHWMNRYTKYLSPSKIVKVSKDNIFNPFVLGALLEIGLGNKWKRGRFSVVAKIIKTSKKIKQNLILSAPAPRTKDPIWIKYGIHAPLFTLEEENKNLKSFPYVCENVSEMKYRLDGHYIPVADMKAYLEKNGMASIYRIAKDTYITYSRAHLLFKDYIKPINSNF